MFFTKDEQYKELLEWLRRTENDPIESMAAFFDARTDSYEEHMAHWAEHYKWMAQLLPGNTSSLLDIGCGSGLELDRIFERFPALNVVGIDLSEKMLSALKVKHGDRNIALICDDYFVHDLGKDKYDVVVAFETLHHFKPDVKARLFKKIYGCLKKGGTYLECDYIASTQEIEDLLFSEAERRRRRDGIKDGAWVHFDTPLTLDHEIEAIRAGGFDDVGNVGFLPCDDHTAMIRAIK